MRYLWQHIFSILEQYKGQTPLSHFFRKYFSQHPKLGSRDRKWISAVIYGWYRTGKGFEADSITEQLLLASLLLTTTSTESVVRLLPERWKNLTDRNQNEKAAFLKAEGIEFREGRMSDNSLYFSAGISEIEWYTSMLQQPDLFLRIRKGKEDIERTVAQSAINREWVTETCLRLPNGTKVEEILPPEAYVVQDASSQKTAQFFQSRKGEIWWDCCCGAGGKTLLLADIQPGIRITASDKRESIISNLHERFRRYKIKPPETFIADATDPLQLERHLNGKLFDAIICDAPCTGSGTWARTPEQFYFFETAQINEYARRQKKILKHIIPYLKNGGKIIYITCSVFKEENEEVIADPMFQGQFVIEEQMLINGIPDHADSMFAAVLRKN